MKTFQICRPAATSLHTDPSATRQIQRSIVPGMAVSQKEQSYRSQTETQIGDVTAALTVTVYECARFAKTRGS
jgi:hypothetical protein